VSRSRRSASGPAWLLGRLPGTDQFDHPRDDLDELVVILTHLAQQLHFVPGDELQPVKIVAELVEPAERGLEGALVGHQEGGGHRIELTGGVVLELAIGGDLSLELDHVLGATIDVAQRSKAYRAHDEQQHDDSQEGGEQLGVHRSRHSRDQPR